jgi:oligopeptide transport system permease protein
MRNVKEMLGYILKRVLLMIFTFLVIFIICFALVRLLPVPAETGLGKDPEAWRKTQLALGRYYYDSQNNFVPTPIFEQFFVFLKNLIIPGTDDNGQLLSRWGYSWEIEFMTAPDKLLFSKLPPTIVLNLFASLFSVPIGIALGIYMALKKNKWQDAVLSVVVMLFISVPSFVYAFLIQYIFGYVLEWLPPTRAPLDQSLGFLGWFTPEMLSSLVLPVLAMSFGSIAGYSRYTRAELTEVLTSDFMLLARTKGLSRTQATVRHAFRNSLVPIFPMLLGEIIGLLSGSIIIESIFTINGVGSLFLEAITKKDYDVFQFVAMFYILIGLLGSLIVDISYGIVDPRIRMGGGKQ